MWIKERGDYILTAKLGNESINCYDGKFDRDTLKKWSTKGILKCPVCGDQYTYNHGKIRIPYFKHLNSECSLFGEPETDEHLKGKRDLYEWISKQEGVTNAILEGWISETKQRPDIMFNYCGYQCVIEFQCTPISTEYEERHMLYQAAGIKDVWICGVRKYIQYYHTGTGNKGINNLELDSKIYYNSDTNQIYKVNYLNNKTFMRYRNGKNIWETEHIMKNPYDYMLTKNNFIFIKDTKKSFQSYQYYPSPTGMRSRKYPYPATGYIYDSNVSIAQSMILNNLKLTEIK